MFHRINIILFGMLFLSTVHFSCAGALAEPYDPKTMLEHYQDEHFGEAYQKANDFVSFAQRKQKQDYFLSLLERGKVALARRDYNGAIKDLQRAEKKFLQIEGQISIGEELSSLFSNELGDLYEAEPHEKILISPYLALAYLAKGDFNGAKVERNRTILKINQYIEKTKQRHLENPFSRYLSAIIYEMEGKEQDAKIEYRKIAQRTKSLRYMTKEINKLGKKTTDLVVFVDAGLAPAKYQVKYGPIFIRIKGINVTIAFAYAKLRRISSVVRKCRVFVDGKKKAKTKVLYNLERTVMKQFKKTDSKRTGNLYKRVLTKQAVSVAAQIAGKKVKGVGGVLIGLLGTGIGAAGAIMERADLRRWSTLPKNIQFCRIRNLKPGKHRILIRYKGGKQYRKVRLKKGKINVVYFVAPK